MAGVLWAAMAALILHFSVEEVRRVVDDLEMIHKTGSFVLGDEAEFPTVPRVVAVANEADPISADSPTIQVDNLLEVEVVVSKLNPFKGLADGKDANVLPMVVAEAIGFGNGPVLPYRELRTKLPNDRGALPYILEFEANARQRRANFVFVVSLKNLKEVVLRDGHFQNRTVAVPELALGNVRLAPGFSSSINRRLSGFPLLAQGSQNQNDTVPSYAQPAEGHYQYPQRPLGHVPLRNKVLLLAPFIAGWALCWWGSITV